MKKYKYGFRNDISVPNPLRCLKFWLTRPKRTERWGDAASGCKTLLNTKNNGVKQAKFEYQVDKTSPYPSRVKII